MAQMVIVVINETQKLNDLMDAWDRIGVPGATILNTSGAKRLHSVMKRDDVPLFMSLRKLMELDHDFVHNVTLISVVDDELVDPMLDAAQKVVGPFEEEDHGIFVTLPIGRAIGVKNK